jgi:hypothetical protein
MEPASPPRRRVPERRPTSPARAGIVRGRRRRRPAGEPPPLPRRLGMTGWWWLGLGTIAILGSTIAVSPGGGGLAGFKSRHPDHDGGRYPPSGGKTILARRRSNSLRSSRVPSRTTVRRTASGPRDTQVRRVRPAWVGRW